MVFAQPYYAYVLFLLPLIALLKLWADARGQRAVKAFASSERLRPSLLGGASPIWAGVHFGLQLLGLGFFIIALTRPQFGTQNQDIQQSGRNIFIAMDTSKSMLAPDVAPNRLTRAKLAAQDLLEKLPGDRVGLIAFAGRAFLQAPLTTDHGAIVESIQALDQGSIPMGGSSLASAIDVALEAMDKIKGQRCGMIVFTDGEETDDATIRAAENAAQKGLLIVPVGVGTLGGTLIPDPNPLNPGDYLRDERGNVVNSKLDPAVLRDVAQLTKGQYIELASQTLTQSLMNRILTSLDKQDATKRVQSLEIERYQWPLFAGIVCFMLSLLMSVASRRRVKSAAALPVDPQATLHPHAPVSRPAASPATVTTVSVVLLFVLLLPSANAEVTEDLQKAIRAYEKGDYKTAQDIYKYLLSSKDNEGLPTGELAYGAGVSMLELKGYSAAALAFSQALRSPDKDLQQRALKGLGRALFDQGASILEENPEATYKSWMDSISHLDRAVENAPNDEKVRENRDFVKSRIIELKEHLDEKKKQQEEQKKKQKSGQKGDSKEPSEGEGDPEDEPQEGKGQQPQEKSSDSKGQGKDRKPQSQDLLQEGPQEVPEGQISAGDEGKPLDDEKPGEGGQNKRNEKTGFTPSEAMSMLQTYADDQKAVQYLMRKEKPRNGKDY